MVSTRGIKYKFFEGEKVLCYEPDPTKAKVLYDSKVLGIYEAKDKRGRKHTQYKIHFQGWNSSWDRKVDSDFVLKDTEENRQLQKDLAEKAQLHLAAHLYRKERKKRVKKDINPDASPSMRNRVSSIEENSSESAFEKVEGGFPMEEEYESDSYSSSVESAHDDERVIIKISERLKQFLEFDLDMIVNKKKQHILPTRIPAITILENFVKQSAVKLVFSSSQCDNPRRRNPQLRPDKKEKDLEKLMNTVSLLKEVADGLRTYLDFTLLDQLLYKEEKDHVNAVFSEENLKKIKYIPSPGLSPEFLLPKSETDLFWSTDLTEPMSNVNINANIETNHPDDLPRRKLRSYRSEEPDVLLENCLSSIASTSSGGSTPMHTSVASSSVGFIKSFPPINLGIPTQTKEYLQKVLSWQILPTNAEPGPSMIVGATHLARLLVKLPFFLNATSMSDEKLRVLLNHLDSFLNYLESHKEWFGEHNYCKDLPTSPKKDSKTSSTN